MPYMILSIIACLGWSLITNAANHFTYVSPQSNILKKSKESVHIKTKNNTHINLTLSKNGELEAAQGVNLNRGDIFIPGQGLLPLSEIEKKMISLGQRTYGRWKLLKYQEYGWIYQVNVAGQERPVFHLVNAYSGHLIGTITTFAPPEMEGQIAKD